MKITFGKRRRNSGKNTTRDSGRNNEKTYGKNACPKNSSRNLSEFRNPIKFSKKNPKKNCSNLENAG